MEIETLRAQAEVEPVRALAAELGSLQKAGPQVLEAYRRNVRLSLYETAQKIYQEVKR